MGSEKVRIGVIIYSIARRKEDPELKVILSCVAGSRPVSPVSKQQQQK